MYLAEKGLTDQVEFVQIDLQGGDNLTPEFAAKNPMKKVPVLELDDGTCISETMAICRYFEELHPEKPLMGRDAKEKALVEQWVRWVDFYFFLPTGMAFQHISGVFKDRMKCFPEWGTECRGQAEKFFGVLDAHLEGREYLVGDQLTTADVSAFCTVEFNKVNRLAIADDQVRLKAWHERMKARPSAGA
ncbi:glutathione S-transferase family protein [Pseudomonas stutzeri]|nr:glutathione S-transferase family protein [Stutzerimonas stutzeri]